MKMESCSIITWNINGIRSLDKFTDCITKFNAHIVCIQETKISRDALDEQMASLDGWTSYFAFCRKRTGYSGVATFCRNEVMPVCAEEGLTGILTPTNARGVVGNYGRINEFFSKQELKYLDYEGRAIITQHRIIDKDEAMILLSIINVYCPRVDPEKPERLEYKLNFLRLLELRIIALEKSGTKVILIGDLNISHKPIDHCDPGEEKEFNSSPSREWLSGLLENGQFLDLFRYFNPTESRAFTCWNTRTNARSTNYGTRIDYIITDNTIAYLFSHCTILKDIFGSDHCPVQATLQAKLNASKQCPSCCSKYYPEFSGKQIKLTDMMSFGKNQSLNTTVECEMATKKRKVSTQLKLDGFIQRPALFLPDTTAVLLQEPKCSKTSTILNNVSAPQLWKELLSRQSKPAPLCKKHKDLCVLRTVTKKGPNINRRFWVCARGVGKADDPETQCNHFEWL